jgi:hypothetical protein
MRINYILPLAARFETERKGDAVRRAETVVWNYR